MSVELPTAGRRRGRSRRPADRPWITLESQFMASTKWVPLHTFSSRIQDLAETVVMLNAMTASIAVDDGDDHWCVSHA